MIIIQDSREKKPLKFTHSWVEAVKVRKLDVGDYKCVYRNNETCNIIFERKTRYDLFGTLTSGYPRFRKEILRAQDNGILLWIIIENSFTSIMNCRCYKGEKITGSQIMKTLLTLYWKYGVMHTFCKSREEMSKFIETVFIWYGTNKIWKQN